MVYIGIKGDGGVKSKGTRLLIEKEKYISTPYGEITHTSAVILHFISN